MKLANHRRIALLSPKMRWKVGSIVSRSSSVSLTSKTISGRAAMSSDSSYCAWSTVRRPSVLLLEPAAVRGLLGAIAADRHAAPPSRASPRVVGEHQRAPVSLARLHVREIFLAHEPRQRFADRQQQGFGRAPAPHRPQLEDLRFQAVAVAMAMPRDLAERFVTPKELVQRSQILDGPGRERTAHVLVNEMPEPLAQNTRLIRNLIQFTGHRSRFQLIEHNRWNKLGLSQPLQQSVAAVEPVDWFIDRCRDGIQEIEAERVGDESRRRSVLHDRPP